MALNFTVIFSQRQHFGDERYIFSGQIPFVGKTKDYSFDCPGVNASETAVLMFQSYDVTTGANDFQINGVEVYGGLPVGPRGEQHGSHRSSAWVGNVLLVEARHQLRATGNVLHVEAHPAAGGSTDIDDFVLDNMVIMYKTTATRPPIL